MCRQALRFGNTKKDVGALLCSSHVQAFALPTNKDKQRRQPTSDEYTTPMRKSMAHEYTPEVDVPVAVPACWYKVAKFERGRLTSSNVFI